VAGVSSADCTVPQAWSEYSPREHSTWDLLFRRQQRLLRERAAPEFLAGLKLLELERPGIPDFAELNERLADSSGWRVVAVPGLVPEATFFEHLANRRFPAGRFIRRPEQLDYLEEPDVFHDVFGHVPLLSDPVFADYLQAYGEGGLRSMRFNALHQLARLYWYTVEFGLVQTPAGLRIYGAGILSSSGESRYALEDPAPNRVRFDLLRIMRTRYRIDDFQQTYFVIESFRELLERTLERDFEPLYRELAHAQELDPQACAPGDRRVELAPRRRSRSA
jgi:phenylalanine-4-hydroxylase